MTFSRRNYSYISFNIFITAFASLLFISFSLMFFVGKIKENKGFNVYLPSSDGYIFKDIEKSQDVLIFVTQDANMFVNNKATMGTDLINNIDLITGGNKENVLKIEMDKSLKYEDVINLTNFLKYNGYQNLVFITD